jgi:hypothetical protein
LQLSCIDDCHVAKVTERTFIMTSV